MAKRVKLTDQIRRALETSGKSRYAIAKTTGVDQAALSRFVHGGGLSMESLDLVAEHLGLKIIGPESRSRKAKGG